MPETPRRRLDQPIPPTSVWSRTKINQIVGLVGPPILGVPGHLGAENSTGSPRRQTARLSWCHEILLGGFNRCSDA